MIVVSVRGLTESDVCGWESEKERRTEGKEKTRGRTAEQTDVLAGRTGGRRERKSLMRTECSRNSFPAAA